MQPNNDDNNNKNNSNNPPTVLISTCLLIAVTVCSSAGTVFDELTTIKDVPPFLAAFWRLFLQNVVQFIPFIISLRKVWREDEEQRVMKHWEQSKDGEDGKGGGGLALNLEMDDEHDYENEYDHEYYNKSLEMEQSNEHNDELILPKYIKSLPLLFVSGFALGTHFSMWVYSLRYTSITHSLLWVSMGPIVLNFGSWAMYGIGKLLVLASCSITFFIVKKPTWLETLGTIVGMSGAVVMLLDTGSKDHDIHGNHNFNDGSHPPSIHGDIAAFTGAVAVCIYLIIGKKVRSWLPIWLYIFPVIGFASFTCLVFALLDNTDKSIWRGMTNISVFGLFSKEYFLYALYLGVGPGILGHTMLSTLLKYISPLIVSTAMLSEPIMGSFIGYIFGMQPMPQLYTWVGGGVLLVGLVLVVIGENESGQKDGCNIEQQQMSKQTGLRLDTKKNENYGAIIIDERDLIRNKK